jgi:hypothetical protein
VIHVQAGIENRADFAVLAAEDRFNPVGQFGEGIDDDRRGGFGVEVNPRA